MILIAFIAIILAGHCAGRLGSSPSRDPTLRCCAIRYPCLISCGFAMLGLVKNSTQPTLRRCLAPAPHQYDALYCASSACSSFIAVSGSTPALRTLSDQVLVSGSPALRHSPSCSAEIG